MKTRRHCLLILALAASPALAGPFVARAAPPIPANVRVLRDLPYGKQPVQAVDVYAPAHAHDAPVVFMVHGGAWRIGDKANQRVVNAKVARWVPRGFVFVSVDYGMLPRTPVAHQVDDIAHALAWAQAHARDWGADPRKFILMGHSAGAHLVDVLAAAPGRAKAAGARPWLGTVSLDSAAVDVASIMRRRHLPLYDMAFGSDPANWKSLSPIELLAPPAPPLLLVCSSTRADDSCGASLRFAERANALGIHASVLPEALSHGQINAALGNPGAYTNAVESFMASLDPAIQRLLSQIPMQH